LSDFFKHKKNADHPAKKSHFFARRKKKGQKMCRVLKKTGSGAVINSRIFRFRTHLSSVRLLFLSEFQRIPGFQHMRGGGEWHASHIFSSFSRRKTAAMCSGDCSIVAA